MVETLEWAAGQLDNPILLTSRVGDLVLRVCKATIKANAFLAVGQARRNKCCKRSEEWLLNGNGNYATTIKNSNTIEVSHLHRHPNRRPTITNEPRLLPSSRLRCQARPRDEPDHHERRRPSRPHCASTPRSVRRRLFFVRRRRHIPTTREPRRSSISARRRSRRVPSCLRSLRRSSILNRRRRRPDATARSRQQHNISGIQFHHAAILRPHVRRTAEQSDLEFISARRIASSRRTAGSKRKHARGGSCAHRHSASGSGASD